MKIGLYLHKWEICERTRALTSTYVHSCIFYFYTLEGGGYCSEIMLREYLWDIRAAAVCNKLTKYIINIPFASHNSFLVHIHSYFPTISSNRTDVFHAEPLSILLFAHWGLDIVARDTVRICRELLRNQDCIIYYISPARPTCQI